MSKKKKDLIFCLLIIAVPAIQFGIFYIGVNLNSLLMAFQSYNVDKTQNTGYYVFNHFENFKTIYLELKYGSEVWTALKNSFVVFGYNVVIGITLALVFSLYIYKKMVLSKFFRVLLFLPSILSSIVTVTMYKYFVESGLPEFLGLANGLLSNPDTAMGTLIFFMIWIGFGTQVLMYSGAMSGIDDSVIEAAKLDGASPLREFVSVILPMIYPTLVTFLVVNVAGIFTNQLNLYSFYGNGAEVKYRTIGYFLFRNTKLASNAELPGLAAYGVVLTVISVPLTLGVRYLLERFGPSEDREGKSHAC
ncbi:MAG: hypothetical protein DBX59_02375 [Bacillota bacterium]|nr:MAG: hypothetical protein DBX59_02375 [Bacillota bacterium]